MMGKCGVLLQPSCVLESTVRVVVGLLTTIVSNKGGTLDEKSKQCFSCRVFRNIDT
jgi:hypothetical protein